MKYLFLFILYICCVTYSTAQDTWRNILQKKGGEVVIYYYDSENYIINKNGKFEGIEYELILELFKFIEKKYSVKIKPKFVRAASFGKLYQNIREGKSGEFGFCSFSMTAQRMMEVNFSPRYMPDIEVMVCSRDMPVVEDTAEFLKHFSKATAYVVRNTTFEDDIQQIKKLIPKLKVSYLNTGVEVLRKINQEKNCFGYAELPNYISSFQEGLNIKRQSLFRMERLGHGFIYPKSSDWKNAIESFFEDPSFPRTMNRILKKQLGNDVKDLLFEMEGNSHNSNEINLLNREVEIQRMAIEKKELESERQRMIRNIFISAIICALVIVFLLFYLNRIKQKANLLLSEQKDEIISQKGIIEEHNKNILDSINYAKLIQESILPPKELFDELLPDSFVIYKPKDIVSGDFYFIGRPQNAGDEPVTVFAVGDCTGHGVPGALLSIIGKTFLQLSLTDSNVNSSADALNYLNQGLVNILKNNKNSLRDGMDIALCAINFDSMEMEFAGGNNPAYIIRGLEVILLKPDKHGIGECLPDGSPKPFKNTTFQLQKNDLIYIFSDGYGDQFGGSKGKKFRASQMRDLFLELREKSMEEQRERIDKAFEDWKGDLEQVDDVCVIGVRV